MADAPNDTATEIAAPPVRQGALGRPMMIVLLVSVTLAFMGLMAAWLMRADDLAEGDASAARQANDAQMFEQDAPIPQIRDLDAADAPAGKSPQI